jgi:hypothetical protein
MFSVSPVEPMVSLDNDPVSQTDDQCTSAEVCVIGDADPVNVALVNATPVQDVALTSENITTSSVANRDAMFGTLGATETLREESLLREEIYKFDSLVDRFSTSATVREKVAVVESMMRLLNEHIHHYSAKDEFTRHVDEYFQDAVQNGGKNREVLIFLNKVQNRDAMFARLSETVREESSLRDKIDMFDSLVDRFSTSAYFHEKLAAVGGMMGLVHDHIDNHSANDEFTRHLQEFQRDAAQNNGINREVIIFVNKLQTRYDVS